MNTEPFVISFSDASVAESNRYAGSLADSLREIDPTLSTDRMRLGSDMQDFGASLAILLGSASATAVAHGIAAWLARQAGARIEISRAGEIKAAGLQSKDAARIAEVFSDRR